MTAYTKAALTVAMIFIALGAVISFGSFVAMGFDFSRLNAAESESSTYTIEESFKNISMDGAECDIRILPSEDGSCRVVCMESKKIYHTITVTGDTLTIQRTDSRKWYDHIGITYWADMELTLYLPETEYNELYVKSVSGNIDIPGDFSFKEAELHNTSGDIHFLASAEDALTAKAVSGSVSVSGQAAKSIEASSTSGEVKISSSEAKKQLTAKSVSGDIDLSDIRSRDITASSTSGDVEFTDVIASGQLRIDTVSGEICLHDSDAGELRLKTTSGDVSGTLLTGKLFSVDTVSGDVDIPRTTAGGECSIKTTSGDIDIEIEE